MVFGVIVGFVFYNMMDLDIFMFIVFVENGMFWVMYNFEILDLFDFDFGSVKGFIDCG